jgi:hypothetical protein
MKKTLMIAVGCAVLGGFAGVAFAERQPHMTKALALLEDAQRSLKEASHDKGGHRAKAMEHINIAIEEVKAGIEFDDKH